MAKTCPCGFIRKNTSGNKHFDLNEDVHCNPKNSVNPDSEPSVRDKLHLQNPS